MKLVAKAKPVKIRITSGRIDTSGRQDTYTRQEHSSLESLKHNFDIEDVRQLLDGRLSRWLKQQGENELAEYIGLLKPKDLDTSKGIIDLMTLFFPEEIKRGKVKNELDLMELWLKSKEYRKNGENLFFFIAEKQCRAETVLYLYKHREELECPVTEWLYNLALTTDDFHGSFKSIEKGNPEVLYIIGRMLFEGYKFYTSSNYAKNPQVGVDLIRKSAKLGFGEAENYISIQDELRAKKEKMLSNVLKDFSGGDNYTLAKSYSQHNSKELLKSIKSLGYIAEMKGYEYALNSYESRVIKEISRCNSAMGKVSCYVMGLLYRWNGQYNKSNHLINKSGYEYPKFNDYSMAGLSFRQQLEIISGLFDYYGKIRK